MNPTTGHKAGLQSAVFRSGSGQGMSGGAQVHDAVERGPQFRWLAGAPRRGGRGQALSDCLDQRPVDAARCAPSREPDHDMAQLVPGAAPACAMGCGHGAIVFSGG